MDFLMKYLIKYPTVGESRHERKVPVLMLLTVAVHSVSWKAQKELRASLKIFCVVASLVILDQRKFGVS